MELALRLNEKVLRFNTFRQYSVADEVRSLQRKNVWNEVAGVEVEPRAPKQKKSAWMDDDAKSEAELAEFIQRHF